MARMRPLIYLLLCLTSVHVLVADAAMHEHLIGEDGAVALADHSPQSGGEGISLLQHCCQCQGFVSPLTTLDAARPPLSPQYASSVPAVPPAPAFGFYRPPKFLV